MRGENVQVAKPTASAQTLQINPLTAPLLAAGAIIILALIFRKKKRR
jgi:hypothetical protein